MPQEVQLALGRIFALGSRAAQPGDVEQYEACRKIILDAAEAGAVSSAYRPDYARATRAIATAVLLANDK